MSNSDSSSAIQDAFLDRPYVIAGRVIDPVQGTLNWQGKVERLRRKELEVLALLASANGSMLARHAFIAQIWDGNALVGDHALSNAISSLRHALRDGQSEHPLIRTIPRRGYQLAEAAVQPVPRSSISTDESFAPGKTVPGNPGWRLLKCLGESEASVSWLAEASEYNGDSEASGRRVFRFCRSESQLRRLQREITVLRYVSKSLSERTDIAVIRDWRLDEPPYYLARDYATHGSLLEWAAVAGGLPSSLQTRMRMMLQLTEGLSALHQLGVVHQRFDAEHILVDETASGPQLKISAFGLSTLADHRKLEPLQITALGLSAAGANLAPDPAEDIYSLGLVLLQLALADLRATASENSLKRLASVDLQALLRRCFGPAETRPSAAELARQIHELDERPQKSTPLPAAPTMATTSISEQQRSPVVVAPPRPIPEAIGTYRLLDQLGEGGMGTVYLAEQRDPYRKVAIKIIRSGLDSKLVLSRFEAERHALAMMNHPNVASVHDSGMSDDGRPFFVMEYIAGEDISSYCNTHHYSLSARIRLFTQVCDGVLHAHQKGVLHRDIKPSNLLVSSAPDNAGTVKVIDFGLAKSLHGKLSHQPLHTSFGAFIGTPIYSSPEYISGNAASVDTRSDIYSLGVVLYELLAGLTPIASALLENMDLDQVREVVCKTRLPSMSEQLKSAPEALRAEIARCRSISNAALPQTLEGDLSWVVGKCLERDPDDRYGSVLELKKDLQRWLELRPVEARPSSAWYRLRKLVRRRRGTVTLVAAALVGLVGATSAAVSGYFRAENALNQAEFAATEARQAAGFQVHLISGIDPQEMAQGFRTNLFEAAQAQWVERQFDANSNRQRMQQLTDTLEGVNYTDLVVKQFDEHYFKPGLRLIEKDYDQTPLLKAILLQSMADALWGMGLVERGLAPQQQALAIRVKRLGENHELTLASKLGLASVLRDFDRLPEARKVLEDLVTGARREAGGKDSRASLQALAMLGVLTDDLVRSETLLREAWQGSKRLLGEQDSQSLDIQVNLAHALRLKGDLIEAAALAEQAAEELIRQLGRTHRDTQGRSRSWSRLIRWQVVSIKRGDWAKN